MFKKDYMERQIEAISNTFAAVLFGKDKVKSILDIEQEEEASGTVEDDILERMVKRHLSEGKINEAEDLILDAISTKKTVRRFAMALDFYNEINKYDNETLSKYDYSKEEIESGIEHLRSLYE